MLEEAKAKRLNFIDNYDKKIYVYNSIPYALINNEFPDDASYIQKELTEIHKYYSIYKYGATFSPEGTLGDYVPAELKYKMSASLINKEARFLFAEKPDIYIEPKGDIGEISEGSKNNLTVLNDLVNTVLDSNNFEDKLLKAAKDCFIGKRVACLVNFNEEDRITVNFINSTNFLYETKMGNPNVLTKFICFIDLNNNRESNKKRVFMKKYTLEDNEVWLEENVVDGAGYVVEEVTKRTKVALERIPVEVFINDGLTGDSDGESEIELLSSYEEWYSKLSNADIDAERKSMNPTKYVVDMESNSTKDLSTSPGSLWDLGSDQNLEKPAPSIGILEPAMSYSDPLKTSLDRIKTTSYEQVDMPNITLESMQGAITSGKALKAIYWPLIVRCKEKMKVWGPHLRGVIDIIIEGSMKYTDISSRYITDPIVPVDYKIRIEQNIPLPEDEMEGKNIDMSEVESKVMSRKSYMKKWRGLSDAEVEEELNQIAVERQILEDIAMSNDMFRV